MGTPIDGAVGGGFGTTRGGGARGNLAADNGRGRAETVLIEAKGGRARHGLEGFICKACLINPPCCSIPRVRVGVSWSSVGHGGNLVLDA